MEPYVEAIFTIDGSEVHHFRGDTNGVVNASKESDRNDKYTNEYIGQHDYGCFDPIRSGGVHEALLLGIMVSI